MCTPIEIELLAVMLALLRVVSVWVKVKGMFITDTLYLYLVLVNLWIYLCSANYSLT